MAENKWCEHLKSYGNELYSWKAVDHHVVTWAQGWKFCPICGKEKPKLRDECELDDLLTEYMHALGDLKKVNLAKRNMIEWKRGE